MIFMLVINVKITVAVVLITPVSLFVASFIAKKTFSMFKLQSETRGEQTGFIEEMIGNQKVVQAFSHEEEALEKFDEINGRLQKYSLRAIFFSSITNPATRFVNSLVYATVAVVSRSDSFRVCSAMQTSTRNRSTRSPVSLQSFRMRLPVRHVFLN